jgi:ketosteroid isomerase-like protein
MSQEAMAPTNTAIVRELYEAWTRGDFRAGEEHFHPDIRFVVDAAVSPSPGEWRGAEAMRHAWREQLGAWEDYRTGPIEQLVEAADLVVAFNRMHGRGKRSGLAADSQRWAAVFRFHDGRIADLRVTDLQGGLAAVGLRD